eukprot:Gb_10345 [translate_table: standard]
MKSSQLGSSIEEGQESNVSYMLELAINTKDITVEAPKANCYTFRSLLDTGKQSKVLWQPEAVNRTESSSVTLKKLVIRPCLSVLCFVLVIILLLRCFLGDCKGGQLVVRLFVQCWYLDGCFGVCREFCPIVDVLGGEEPSCVSIVTKVKEQILGCNCMKSHGLPWRVKCFDAAVDFSVASLISSYTYIHVEKLYSCTCSCTLIQCCGGPELNESQEVFIFGFPFDAYMKIAQLQQQQQHPQQQNSNQQQQLQQQALSTQQPQVASHHQQQQDKIGVGGVTVDGSMSSSFRGNDQSASKGQSGRKRKQPVSSSGPANSSGTANTAGPSPSSAPSTPSTHTPGDVMSMAGALQHSGSSSKPLMMFGSDGTGTLASPSNPLWDDKGIELQADIDRFVEDGSLDDNVESFLSHDDTDPRDAVGRCMDVSKGFSFNEVGCLRASTSKVVCCHFSSDGKLLASAGHEKKAVLWNMDTLKLKSSLEEHSFLITDVRFSPNSTRLATSSFDRTVRVWDADNPSYSLRTFTGHSTSVMSLDFHPNNEDLICSCDGDSQIFFWSINQGIFTKQFRGGMSQMRFQPRLGSLLAAAAENVVSIFDVETEHCLHSLQRHTKPVHSVCWDPTGDYVASVSEDSVRVWALGSGSDAHISILFRTKMCSFTRMSLELWNMAENKSMTIPAHEGLIAALAVSNATGMVASASHDKCVKLWK